MGFKLQLSFDGRQHVSMVLLEGAVVDGGTFERLDDPNNYGEDRWFGVGVVEGIELTVIYTDVLSDRGEVRRIISARRATKNERQAYYQAQ